MTRLALAIAYFLSFMGAAVLLYLSFRTHPGWAYSGFLLLASGRAVELALVIQEEDDAY